MEGLLERGDIIRGRRVYTEGGGYYLKGGLLREDAY